MLGNLSQNCMKTKQEIQKLVDILPHGSGNAISREELCFLLKLDDRTVRDLIKQARRHVPILNMQNGKGYFIPDIKDKPLVDRWLRQETKRAKSSLYSLRGAKEFLKAN